ncbi:hypothetical protein C8R48DRAFT_764757 [Suillus tomentosus]|nr:hypothetical protein C8R48DRAFT_764757 [Suillus tomentosus]
MYGATAGYALWTVIHPIDMIRLWAESLEKQGNRQWFGSHFDSKCFTSSLLISSPFANGVTFLGFELASIHDHRGFTSRTHEFPCPSLDLWCSVAHGYILIDDYNDCRNYQLSSLGNGTQIYRDRHVSTSADMIDGGR